MVRNVLSANGKGCRFTLHLFKMVTRQNGSVQNGTDKMVWTKWYRDKMVLDNMVWTNWYNFISYVHFNIVEFNIYFVTQSHKYIISTQRKAKGVKVEAGLMTKNHMVNGSGIDCRAVPNIRFVFASGPNSGMNIYSVFGRIVAIGPNTNSDICFFVCGGHSEWRGWRGELYHFKKNKFFSTQN